MSDRPVERATAGELPLLVTDQLAQIADRYPEQIAVAQPARRRVRGRGDYRTISFAELDSTSRRLAAALVEMGMQRGMRIVLLTPPGIEFFQCVFAMLRASLVTVLIDPGMGKRNLIQCLSDVGPQGFVAVPRAHLARVLYRQRFSQARLNVTIGRRWLWGGKTLQELLAGPLPACFSPLPNLAAEDPAAIIFTSGGTGPPKGVLYSHGNFARQVTEIRDYYRIAPGEIDLAGFPLFGLFNAAMGVTTVIPQMDFSRPATVDPRRFVQAARDWQATQSFGSPAIWNVVGRYCEKSHQTMESLRRVLSAGAPVPPHVLQRVRAAIHPQGEMHTPYGATEALPVASIAATEVLKETAALSAQGRGTCVGRRFPGIDWRVIAVSDRPIANIQEASPLPSGEIGELIVRGEVVTREYVTRPEANPLHKIPDGSGVWHRMGDLGYLDTQDRFWFCGRKVHRVVTERGPMYTIPCEAMFNRHPRVFRSALVGVGRPGRQLPAIVVETWPDAKAVGGLAREQLLEELAALGQKNDLTRHITHFFIHPGFPVDVRHNAKIDREQLARWVARQLDAQPVESPDTT